MNAADIENRVLELNKKQESEDTAKAGFWEEFEVSNGDQQGDRHRVPGRPHALSTTPYTDLCHVIFTRACPSPSGGWCFISPLSPLRACRSRR